MISTIQRISFVVFATFSLPGCFDTTPTTTQLCDTHSNLECERLNMRDGQCLNQRDTLILSRFKALESQHDLDKLEALQATYRYQSCLVSAAQIEPITAKEVKTKRSEALLHTYDAVDALNAELAQSTEPKVLYYRWSAGDELALNAFLQLEGTPPLETAELQYSLATFYALRDTPKTINLLNHALELLTENDYQNDFHSTVITSLATLNHKEHHMEYAYLWVLVGKEFNLPISSEKQLNLLYSFSDEKKDQLKKASDEIIDSIKEQTFSTQLLPIIESKK